MCGCVSVSVRKITHEELSLSLIPKKIKIKIKLMLLEFVINRM